MVEMVTLRDIAEQVGVSASAVSLVLNDRDRGRIRADVAERIREVAAELGYVPNLFARGLKTRQSLTIVVLDGRPNDPGVWVDWVVPDEAGGVRTATERLFAAGHRRIGFCNVADAIFVARKLRRTGYETVLRKAGLTIDPALVVEAA